MYSIHKIKSILGNTPVPEDMGHDIFSLEIDSRKIVEGKNVLFFCLHGKTRDGHDYIEDAYSKGVRWFVVARQDLPDMHDIHYIKVDNVLHALQQIAGYRRQEYSGATIIGITGSNAKTIVKEWLFQLCHPPKKAVRSPKSYNSQIGVALSLWLLNKSVDVGIIEAGISKSGEMDTIAKLIDPDIGIFTNVGDAHSAGFKDLQEKVSEKSKLFRNTKKIVVHSGHEIIYNHLLKTYGRSKIISWGYKDDDDFKITISDPKMLIISGDDVHIVIPVSNLGIHHIENLMHVVVAALAIGIDPNVIATKVPFLSTLEMRLEHIAGRDNSTLINDAYIADLASLQVAMNHVGSVDHHGPLTVVLSDFYDQQSQEDIYHQVTSLLKKYNVDRLITVGEHSKVIEGGSIRYHYENTELLLAEIDTIDWNDHLVLFKGSRVFQLDTLVSKLERSSHSAYLEINIPALHHNLTEIRNHCPSSCGLIAVIKASAYGAGIEKIASAINDHDPSYYAVAYADEGIKMRNHGIRQPIIILNPDEDKVEILSNYDLEPVVHNMSILHQLARVSEIKHRSIGIHIKLDTGMHRLGFSSSELNELCSYLQKNNKLKVKTVFSHLSASENKVHDKFTHKQARLFEAWSLEIKKSLGYMPKRHLLNSEGIWRFPQYAFDFVRAGITMYGISRHRTSLKKVHSLNAKIISITHIKKGESIGYGRSEILEKDSWIGVINIGYSDGLMRAGSNGKTSVYVNGVRCPVVGKICMDVAMIDVSLCHQVDVGDNAEVFGNHISIEEHAANIDTIPYEVLCNISPRIVRRYIMD